MSLDRIPREPAEKGLDSVLEMATSLSRKDVRVQRTSSPQGAGAALTAHLVEAQEKPRFENTIETSVVNGIIEVLGACLVGPDRCGAGPPKGANPATTEQTAVIDPLGPEP